MDLKINELYIIFQGFPRKRMQRYNYSSVLEGYTCDIFLRWQATIDVPFCLQPLLMPV